MEMMSARHAAVSLWLLHINDVPANEWHYACMIYWTDPVIIQLSSRFICYTRSLKFVHKFSLIHVYAIYLIHIGMCSGMII